MPPTYQVDCYLLFLCFKLPPTKWIATPSKTTTTYLPGELLPSLVVVRYLLVLFFFFVFFLVLEEIHFSFFAYLPACWESTTSKHVFLGEIAAREWAAATTMNACDFPPILVNSFSVFATDFGEDHMPVARNKGRKGKERKGGKEGRKEEHHLCFLLIDSSITLTDWHQEVPERIQETPVFASIIIILFVRGTEQSMRRRASERVCFKIEILQNPKKNLGRLSPARSWILENCIPSFLPHRALF